MDGSGCRLEPLGLELARRADAARAFLTARGDLALGLVPQAVLGPTRADAWACFWAGVRRVDDSVEEGGVPARWADAVARVPEAGADLEAALSALSEPAAGWVRARAPAAWEGLRQRAAWDDAPSLSAYLSASAAMAGFPMRFFYAAAGVEPAGRALGAFCDLLGVSVQLGDDLRDVTQDAKRGLWTVTREERSLVEASEGEAPAVLGRRVAAYRVRLSAWFLRRALGELPVAPRVPGSRLLGLPLLWHRALRDGQVVPTRRRLRVPGGRPSDVSSARRALGPLLAPADDEPEAVAGILRQDLLAMSRGLDPWSAAVAHQVAASLGPG